MIAIKICTEGDGCWWARIVQCNPEDRIVRMLNKRFARNHEAWAWAYEITKNWQSEHAAPTPAA